MARKRNSKSVLLSNTKTTTQAEILSSTKGRSRSGRDGLTRVQSPIKGVPTQSRQWNRWSP